MNRATANVLAFALFLIMPNPSESVSSSEIANQLEQCNRKGGNCIQGLEAAILAKPGSKAKHSGDTLAIHTRSKIVSFKDRPDAGDQVILHAYLGLLDGLNYHLVVRRLWEGGNYILVSDASGEQFTMDAIPHESPGGKMMVAVSAIEVGDGPIDITIWRVTPERLTKEFHYAPAEYVLFRFVAWEGETKIQLEKFTRSKKELCPNSQFMTVGEILQLSQGAWQFVAETPTKVKCK